VADEAEGSVLVIAVVERDVVRLSVDTSGEPLHRRGWRLATAKAPLRETLAAALVLLSGWDRRTPLLDPFCGSGTVAIEAALLARQVAPGLGRTFAFERWPGHDVEAWAALREAAAASSAAAAAARPAGPTVVASDRDEGAVEAARANATRAGVAADVEIVRRSVSDVTPPPGGPGAVVTNPPHGRRLSAGRDLVPVYGRFGSVVRRRLPGWRVAFLTSSVRYQTATRLAVSEVRKIDLGGQSVRVVLAMS
jgi:putative N6-adenine-specific DNA methylase